MRRDLLLISEMIAAAEQAQSLVADADLDALGVHTTATDLLPAFATQLRAVMAELDGEGS